MVYGHPEQFKPNVNRIIFSLENGLCSETAGQTGCRALVQPIPKTVFMTIWKNRCTLQSKLIKEKLKPQNSEWFQRPKVATSEIAERCSENLEFVQQLMSGWSLDEMIAILQKYWDMEYPLITKNDAPVIAESLSKMMQFHCTNIPKEVRFFEDMERSGNILFNYAVHFRSLLALIVNTTEYAQQMQMPGRGGGDLKIIQQLEKF